MRKKILVIGVGRFGSALIQELHKSKHDIIAIDTDEKRLEEVNDYVVYSVVGDAKEKDVLVELDVTQFDTIAVAIGTDFEASVLITKRLKDLQCEFVICKAMDKQMGEILQAVGASKIVYPEKEAGVRTAKSLLHKGLIEYIEISEDVSGIEVEVPSLFYGKSLSHLDFARKYGLNVALILRNKKPLLSNIASVEFEVGDYFLLIGDNRKINNFKEKFCN